MENVPFGRAFEKNDGFKFTFSNRKQRVRIKKYMILKIELRF